MDCQEIISCIQVNDYLLVSKDNHNLLRVLNYIQNINNSIINTDNINLKLLIESDLECMVNNNEQYETYQTKINQETIKRKNNKGLIKLGSKRKIKGLETTLLSSPLSSSSSSSSTPSSSSSFSSSSAIKSPISMMTPPNKRNK